jgi:SWI/SNF-related matrix-associated actin-dependent regulator 1 of chromatin subfamily A
MLLDLTDDERVALLEDLSMSAQALAASDGDYAQEQNGVGFSQADTYFGHELAATPAALWPEDVVIAGIGMLRHYRSQLDGIVDTSRWPSITRAGDRTLNRIGAEGDRFMFHFRYDPDLVDAVKRLPGRRYNAAERVWTAGAGAHDVIESWASDHGFVLLDDAADLIERCAAGKVEDDAAYAGRGRLVLVDDHHVAFEFPGYDADAVEAVKQLPERRWDSTSKRWLIPTPYASAAEKVAANLGVAVDPSVVALDSPDIDPDDTAMRVATRGASLLLNFPFDPTMNKRVKQLPGAKWSMQERGWLVDCLGGLELAELMTHVQQVITEDSAAGALLARANEALARVAHSSAEDADYDVAGLGGELRSYQRASLSYFAKDPRGFIADEMGTGKTIQALALLEDHDAFPAVIVVPAVVRVNWQREAERWLPHRSIGFALGQAARPRDVVPDITIISYAVLSHWVDTLVAEGPPKGAVFDESHYCAKRNIRTTAAQRLTAAMDEDAVIPLLTGTPMVNSPMDYWEQLVIAKRTAEFGVDRADFGKRWSKNPVGLNRLLRSTCFIRRLKADVAKDIPAKQWVPVYLEGDPTAMREYADAQRDIIEYLMREARAASLASGSNDAEAQRDAWQAAIRANAAKHLVAVSRLRRLAAMAKMPSARTWMDDLLADGRKAVVFAHHRDVTEEIRDRFADGCAIIGGMGDVKRQAAIDRFQNDESQQVVAAALTAAGVGVTLTAASDVVFVEQGWTAKDMDQGIDRCHRIGQTEAVTGYVLMVPDTIDEWMFDLIADKRVLVSAGTDGARVGPETVRSASVLGDLLIGMVDREGGVQ